MSAADPLAKLRSSVVKVMTVSDPPDYEQPWQTLGASGATGSGVIVDTLQGKRILTNAHVVEDATFVEVRRYGQDRKVEADVVGFGEECDLALLAVEDPTFFRDAKGMQIGALPRLGDPVTVLGFPIGGERLSVTEGVVSRLELTTYAQNERDLLTVQIDAAVNSGNSGGPVVLDGKLGGIAFQALDEGENIGYVIPAPVVQHFLQDVENPPYAGFPDLGISVQDLESRAHRKYLGMPRSRIGVRVTHVHYEGSCWGVVQPDDVLLAVDGEPIASDGTVRFGTASRIEYPYVASKHYVGEEVPLRLFREGKRITRRITLQPQRALVPARAPGGRPTWYIYGGFLFVPLTRAWLETWGENWRRRAPDEIVALYDYGVRTSRSQEIVVLQKVLADQVNRGYHDMESVRILRAQGKRLRNMRDLVRIVDGTRKEFVVFEASDRSRIVLERKSVSTRSNAILKRYGVPKRRSADLVTRRAGR